MAPLISLSPRMNKLLSVGGIVLLLAIFVLVLIRTAWQSDDAFITYRTIDNFIHGHGLTYNPGWRVQAFTHPLWMFLHIPAFAISGEAYFTGLIISLLVTGVAVFLGLKVTKGDFFTSTALILLFIFSKAFTDYATSGLENPLSHVLLAIFAIRWWKGVSDKKAAWWLVFIAALAILNRMDTALLFFPALLWLAWKFRHPKTLLYLGTAFFPLILWIGFSLFYYGFPFPNTAYAKLGAGVTLNWKLSHGIGYFMDSLQRDTLTLLVIFAALIVVFGQRFIQTSASSISKSRIPGPPDSSLLAGGILLYLAYICWIGGDFMSGRFFTAPFFLSAIILVKWGSAIKPRIKEFSLVGVFLLGFFLPGNPVFSGKYYGTEKKLVIGPTGVADERAYYFPTCGLINQQPGTVHPAHFWAGEGLKMREKHTKLTIHSNQGFLGYYGGPEVHIIDPLALTDPFLARMPRNTSKDLRPGHIYRVIPEGYPQCFQTGQNHLQDSTQAVLFDKLHHICTGDLWDMARLKEIVKMNLGYYANPPAIEQP